MYTNSQKLFLFKSYIKDKNPKLLEKSGELMISQEGYINPGFQSNLTDIEGKEFQKLYKDFETDVLWD